MDETQLIALDPTKLELLVTQILTKVNDRIQERIVDTVAAGDTKHTPSADAVQKAIIGMSHWKAKVVVGNLPETGDANTIYLQKDSEEDPSWMLNIYTDEQWISVGDTEIDLSDYYTKEEAEGKFATNDDINDIESRVNALENANVLTKDELPDLTANFFDKTNADDIADLKESLGIEAPVSITDEKITEIVNAAYAASAPDLT